MTKSKLQALRARAADDNGACAELCWRLRISCTRYFRFARAHDYRKSDYVRAYYRDHNSDRLTAWRAAVCQVADKVIEGVSDV